MNEPTLDSLTRRLDWLERENRRMKLGGAILLLALAAMGAMGQVLPKAVPKVVEAERFVLRDTTGKILATMDTKASGTALALFDQNGKTRTVLAVLPDGTPSLSLGDQNDKIRAELGVNSDGAGLSLSDQNGKIRALLGVQADGTSGLSILDQNDKERLLLSVATRGPSLILRDENRTRAVLGHTALEKTATGTVEQRPASSVVLFDRDGKVIWRAP